MSKLSLPAILLLFLTLVSLPSTVLSAEILGPKIKIESNDIFVTTGLSYLGELNSALESGIEKEIIFTIELFRVWKLWPDEFVVSKRIRKTIKYDNLRSQYLTTTHDGAESVNKIFRDFSSMKSWIFWVNNINLANIRELVPGSYYLRVVAESKSIELPPVIGLLMLFIPEVEMSLAKESQRFIIGNNR
jgi:hypothetical protein